MLVLPSGDAAAVTNAPLARLAVLRSDTVDQPARMSSGMVLT